MGFGSTVGYEELSVDYPVDMNGYLPDSCNRTNLPEDQPIKILLSATSPQYDQSLMSIMTPEEIIRHYSQLRNQERYWKEQIRLHRQTLEQILEVTTRRDVELCYFHAQEELNRLEKELVCFLVCLSPEMTQLLRNREPTSAHVQDYLPNESSSRTYSHDQATWISTNYYNGNDSRDGLSGSFQGPLVNYSNTGVPINQDLPTLPLNDADNVLLIGQVINDPRIELQQGHVGLQNPGTMPAYRVFNGVETHAHNTTDQQIGHTRTPPIAVKVPQSDKQTQTALDNTHDPSIRIALHQQSNAAQETRNATKGDVGKTGLGPSPNILEGNVNQRKDQESAGRSSTQPEVPKAKRPVPLPRERTAPALKERTPMVINPFDLKELNQERKLPQPLPRLQVKYGYP
jgi:hypothetical protein